MEKFVFKARDENGKAISGIVEANNVKEAAKVLHDRKLFVIAIKPKGGNFFSNLFTVGRVSVDEKVNFTRQLATMINAGLPITEALHILSIQGKPGMMMVIRGILREIEAGSSFSEAISKHPKVFDQIYISLVKAGETAGVLNQILSRLADNLEKQRDFSRKIKGAMIYPVIIIVGMMAVVVVMMIFVIPKLSALYSEFNAKLPLATRILLGISGLATKYIWAAGLLVPAVFIAWRLNKDSPVFRNKLDRLMFRLPIFGKLRQQLALTEFTRTFGLLVGSGVLVIEALNIVKSALGSPVYQKAIEEVGRGVEKGLSLAATLADQPIFPPILSQMIAIGEETGKLDEILAKVSAYFEEEAEGLVRNLTTAMEPLIMVLLGVGVGFLMIAIIMPIYQLTSQF